MIYLPKKIGVWFSQRAQERGLEQGEIIYAALRLFAEQRGFECTHPEGEHIKHKKGNSTLFRCNLCGYLFYKKPNKRFENSQLVTTYELIPRIEEP